MASTLPPEPKRRIWVTAIALLIVTVAVGWLLLKPAADPTPAPVAAEAAPGPPESGLVEFRFSPPDPSGPQPMKTFRAPHLPPVSITRLAKLTESPTGVYRSPAGGELVSLHLARLDPFAPPGQGLVSLGNLPTTATPGSQDVRFQIPLKLLQPGKAYKIVAAMADGVDVDVLAFVVANV